jgi:hypothetical protein
MAEPWTFNFNPTEQTFTFNNEHVTFEAKKNIDSLPPSEPVTVESVTLTIPHDDTFVDLGITKVEVPPPVIEHLLGHF